MEHARGPRREGRRDGDRRRAMWVDKYGPPTRTKYRMVVENLSTKMSWQVRLKVCGNNLVGTVYDIEIQFFCHVRQFNWNLPLFPLGMLVSVHLKITSI